MNHTLSLHKKLYILILSAIVSLSFASCSDDDTPVQRSEYDIVGIWQDSDKHILEIADPDKLYDYDLQEFEDTNYWIKRKVMYFFEPYSYLMMKTDSEGTVQLYKVVSVGEKEMVLSWIGTPDISEEDSDNKFQIFSVFFKDTYTVNPANNVTYRKITQSELNSQLTGIEIIEP